MMEQVKDNVLNMVRRVGGLFSSRPDETEVNRLSDLAYRGGQLDELTCYPQWHLEMWVEHELRTQAMNELAKRGKDETEIRRLCARLELLEDLGRERTRLIIEGRKASVLLAKLNQEKQEDARRTG